MITLSDIKREHQNAVQIVDVLTSRLAEEKSHTERSELITKLNYWDTVQHYILTKYKEKEKHG